MLTDTLDRRIRLYLQAPEISSDDYDDFANRAARAFWRSKPRYVNRSKGAKAANDARREKKRKREERQGKKEAQAMRDHDSSGGGGGGGGASGGKGLRADTEQLFFVFFFSFFVFNGVNPRFFVFSVRARCFLYLTPWRDRYQGGE